MLSQTKTIAFFMLVNVVHSLPKTLLDWPADIKAQYDLQFPLATNKDPSIPRKTNTGVKAGAGNGNKGHGRRLDNFVFRGPMSTQEACTIMFAPWWDRILSLRTAVQESSPKPVDHQSAWSSQRISSGRTNAIYIG